MVKFDTSLIPSGSVISGATLMMYVNDVRVTNLVSSLNVHRIASDWVESQVKWVYRTTADNWISYGGDYDGTVLSSCAYAAMTKGGWVSFSLPTNVVQGWVDSPSSNRGVLIKPSADGDPGSGVLSINMAWLASSESGAVSNRPKLVLTYTAATNVKPLVVITAPAKNSILTNANTVVTADALDTDGSVTGVEFFMDGISIGRDTTAPYSAAWQNVSAGAHVLTACAMDNTDAASTSATVTVYASYPVYSADMSSNPGWTFGSGWAYGVPLGVDSNFGYPDPTSGVTGTNVVGYNLGGPYSDNMAASYATTPAFDCSLYQNTVLTFWYWLGVDSPDNAKVSISTDGSTWQDLWTNPYNVEILPGGVWRQMKVSMAVADGQPSVRLRWQMGPSDYQYYYGGWNIDDVCVLGNDRNLMTDTNAISMAEGSNATFSVKLAYAPTTASTVTVARASGDPGISVTNGSTLVFTTNNWNAWQTVTVASARDADTTNQIAVVRCTGPHFSVKDVSVLGVDYDCAPPASVTASDGLFTNKVALTWSSSPYAEWYEVWRGTNALSGMAVRIADHVAGTSYDDFQVGPSIKYYYWIKSIKSDYVSDFSAMESGYTSLTWNYKMKISANGYSRDETLTNFPLLVVLSTNLPGFSYNQFLSPTNGADLRFVNASEDTTTMLNYEIDTWDTNGSSYIWVQIPQLASNMFMWAYWGCQDQVPPYPSTTNGATWDPTFRGVWHLREPAATMTIADSSSYQYNATANSQSIATTNGVVGAGKAFPADGNSSIFSGSTSLKVSADLTFSAWVRPTTTNGEQQLLQNGTSWYWAINPKGTRPGKQGLYYTYSAPVVNLGNTDVSTGQWSYVAAAYSSGIMDFYWNGQPDGTTNATPAGGLGTTMICKYFTGSIDELRVESVKRSSNWVWACYQNMVSNTTFMSYSLPMSTPASWACPAESGIWSNPANWSPVLVPGLACDVLLATSGHTAVVDNANCAARSITFSSIGDFMVAGASNTLLTVSSDITVSNVFANTLDVPLQLGGDAIWTVPVGGSLKATRPISGNARLTKAGAGSLTLLGANTHARGTTIAEGTLVVGNGGVSGGVAGPVTDNALLVFNHGDLATNSTLISGTGALTKTGEGTLVLTGSNTYAGATTVNAGTLRLAANQFGTGTVMVASGARLELAVSNSGTSNSVIQASVVNVASGATVAVQANYPFGLVGSAVDSGLTINLAGALDLGSLTESVFGGVAVNLSGGTLTGSAGSLWSVGAKGAFMGNINSLASASPSVVKVGSVRLRPAGLLTNIAFGVESGTTAGGVDLDVQSAISSTPTYGGLVKTGAGVLQLSGTNTYAGVTVVSNGTLVVNGRLYTNAVTVFTGAVLAGGGVIGGPVTVSDGAQLSPGGINRSGTLIVSNTLAVANGAVMNFALGTTGDSVVVTGALTVGGTLNVTDAGGFGPGTYALFTYGGALTNNGVMVGTVPNAVSYNYSVTNVAGQVQLVVTLSRFGQWQVQQFGSVTGANTDSDADPDRDGMNNWDEYLAGTLPSNALSRLMITNTAVRSVTGHVLAWPGVSGHVYSVERSTNLLGGFAGILSNLPWMDPVNTVTDDFSGTPVFYRIKAGLAP